MINFIQKLIEELVLKEKEVLGNYDVGGHTPTIGEMYEGLTKKLSNISLKDFEELDLRVVCGFIIDSNNNISGEIDCMIVVGEGEEVPGDKKKYKYNVNNVIAVFEVKKELNKTELNSAIKHLSKITKLKITKDIEGKLAHHAYRGILRKEASLEKFGDIYTFDASLKAILISESAYPLRVIISYGGYKTEKGFRYSFENLFAENIGDEKYSLLALPNLIISDNYSILKLNGMPYSYYKSDTEWLGFASAKDGPFRILLELIWTRLTYQMHVPVEVFGDDLSLEQFSPLIKFRYIKERKGFEGIPIKISSSELKKDIEEKQWEPAEITEKELVFLQLIENHDADISHNEIALFLKENKINIINFCENLRAKNLGYLQDNKFYYLTDALTCVALPDGKIYAADNASGRFTNWLNSQKNK